MARIDKYDPVSGGFRARLGWTPVAAEVGDVIAVTINGTGLAIKTTAATDVCEGVVCMSSLLNLNDVVDVMTDGEIVDIAASGDNVSGQSAGSVAYVGGAGGAINATAPGAGVNGTKVGRFIEAWRLVVRVGRVQG
jgi:hypothetical protein